ncbi:MAG: VOC family protein [Pigmentiphaga sp.]|uniref:VOC family protein n=1 Tax=Pigmentiphaga sp. TaxID=1977564 RepID=UPI0029B2F8D3|nr:VOC family protein [Pigmentiphaga sp.]MDX3905934.1 VOC family protein [Pigmentiphaga sp.]
MAIVGIHSLTYHVSNLDTCTAFMEAFGLARVARSPEEARFGLPDGATVFLRRAARPEGHGTVETVWGVDTLANLEAAASRLAQDRTVVLDETGVFRFQSDCGMAMGLAVFERKPVLCAPDPVNAPGRVQRLDTWRKWRTRAAPRTINHVVYGVDDYKASWDFFRHRLGFRLSDHSRGLGVFLRADGAPEHHTLFLQNCHYHAPGTPGFLHACFGVEDIDELMAGANYMARLGHRSKLGVGRHRIASALFYYLDCPAGGEIEYGADTDYLDDHWMPREWDPKFGFISWCANLPPFLQEAAAPDVRVLASEDDVDIPDLAAYRLGRRG